jgi:pimeloyl-ACP methyl ester carboxylesterase
MDPDVLKPIIAGRWYESYELDTILPRVRCPTLLLQADAAAGGMLSDEDADQIIEGTPDTIRIRFPNVGHLLHWQATEATLRHVQGFLESV